MKFFKTGRNNHEFTCPPGLMVNAEGVYGNKGIIKFDKGLFQDEKACRDWLQTTNAKFMQTCQDSHAKDLKVLDSDWELISKRLVKSENVGLEDVEIFEDWLAFNVVDREAERFSKKALTRFNETITGKQKLISHDWSGGAGAIGVYFKSRLQKVSVDDMLEITNYPDKGRARAMMEEIESIDRGLYWLVPTYYVPKYKDLIIKDISFGLYPSSIGFIGAGWEEVKDEKGNIKYWEYVVTSRTEAVEGSLVGVEAQHGARTRKSYDKVAFHQEGDEAGTRELHQVGDEGPKGKSNGGPMQIKMTNVPYEGEVTDLEGVKDVIIEIDSKILAAIESKQAELDKVQGEKEAAETALNAQLSELKAKSDAIVAERDELKADLANDVIKARINLGLTDVKDEDGVKALKDLLIVDPVSMLKSKLADLLALDKRTAKSQLDEEEVSVATHVPDNAFQQGV